MKVYNEQFVKIKESVDFIESCLNKENNSININNSSNNNLENKEKEKYLHVLFSNKFNISKLLLLNIYFKIIILVDLLFSLKSNINLINSQFIFDLSSAGKLIVNKNNKILTNDTFYDLFNSFSVTNLDLNEAKYKEDISVLDEDCKCFSCKENKYTKAYLNHLFFCSELNGPIILIMHNLFYLEYLIKHFNNSYNEIKDISLYEYISKIYTKTENNNENKSDIKEIN